MPRPARISESSIRPTPTATPSPRSSSTSPARCGNSWDDDAFPKDKTTGVYADQSKRHAIDHEGQYFSVKGPLNTSRSPQGHPIIVQSGSSEPGQQLAARTADVVFTAQQSLESARAFYRELKGRLGVVWPPAGIARHHAGIPAGARRHRKGGARQARAAGQLDRPEQGRADVVGPAGPRRLAATISMGRCRNCRRPISCRAARSSSPTPRAVTTSRSANWRRWSPPAAATM